MAASGPTDPTGYDSRHSIASILRPVEVPRDQWANVCASQLESTEKLGIIIVLTNLLNASLVLVMFSTSEAASALGLWGSVMCMTCAVIFMRTVHGMDANRPRMALNWALFGNIGSAFVFGSLWGILPLFLLPSVDPFGQMVVGILLSGMIFAGSFALSRLPLAAFAFILPVGAGLLYGFAQLESVNSTYLSMMTVVYITIVTVCVRWNHNQFLSQFLNKAAIAHQSALIGLLLRDFEESTSDWLWQTDRDGSLQALPMSLKGSKSGYEKMSHGTPLLDLFRNGEARNILVSSLERQQGFRDLVLQVDDAGEPTWWSLTGKPILEDGEFHGFRGVASDVTQSKQIEDRIAYMAHYDGLTGLPNRATFQEKFERICSTPIAPGRERAVILLDLDNFKWVNDTLGHPAGDELLRQIGTRLSQHTEPQDTIARLGGDEFAAIVERDSVRELDELFERLLQALSRAYDVWGSTANCGASLGVRGFSGETLDPGTLLTQADLALYQAKKKGKGNWVRFTPDLEERARARRLIEADLHQALQRDELHLKFQPIVNSKTGKVASCETLLRWQHPERGPIMPGEFIEHAEDCGLIVRMGDWVIREALAEARRLPDDVSISINISPLQLHSASLVSTIVNALAVNDIHPSRLDLEITESVLLSDTGFVLERLLQLRELGLRLSLDDFGTGFSSLSYLRSFPFDKIKIDKSFIRDLETNDDSRVITKTTVGLAKSLGLKCTAEGVETKAQHDFLVRLGCDELQGYYISRAHTLDDLTSRVDLALRDVPQVNSDQAAALTSVPRAARDWKAGPRVRRAVNGN